MLTAPHSSAKQLVKNLSSYEDFLSAYIQLDQSQSGLLWVKADLINEMTGHLGTGSMKELAKDIRQPSSTVINYVRTSRAFPGEKRHYNLSFSLHFQASLADSYDSASGMFDGENRFTMLNQAIDNNWSTRQLEAEIQHTKKGTVDEQTDVDIPRAHEMLEQIHQKSQELFVQVQNGETQQEAYKKINKIFKIISA